VGTGIYKSYTCGYSAGKFLEIAIDYGGTLQVQFLRVADIHLGAQAHFLKV